MSHAPSLLYPSQMSTTSLSALSTCSPIRLSTQPPTKPLLTSSSHGDYPAPIHRMCLSVLCRNRHRFYSRTPLPEGCPIELLQMVFGWHCSLEHQVVATPCKLAKMSSVTWQLIATRRLYRTISPGVHECVICAGEIAVRRLH